MKYKVMDGNSACAHISYMFSDAASIYPITPASTMAEKVDEWSNKGKINLYGDKVKVVEMQSEAGAIGTVHGLLQTGLVASTYTASQGLLLMIPNMYKIAGELLPSVINVAARTIATHSLSIFGDHSDIYAVRQTGYSMLSSSNVQDVMYMTLISYLSTFKGKIPFVNFFDGFRTSHELSKIKVLEEDDIKDLVDYDLINEFRKNSSLAKKQIRGTTQNDDVYFQNIEARNKYYDEMPSIVNEYMELINKKFDTDYHPFDYYGAVDAEKVIVAMGSVCDTIKEVVDELNSKEEKVGLIIVRLYRPFSSKYFLKALPNTVKKIAVLDRTKESGSAEPLYLDVVNVLNDAGKKIKVIGGRYGLSSKNTEPSDINAVFNNLDKKRPINSFTIGIVDDVTNKSLDKVDIKIKSKNIEMLVYGYGSDGMVTATKDIITLVGDNTNGYVQGYNQYDSKKSGGVTMSHLRIGKEEIKSSYYVKDAHIVVCTKDSYLDKYDMISNIRKNGIFIVNTTRKLIDFPDNYKYYIAKNNVKVYIIDANKIANENGIPNKISTIMEAAIIKITKVLPYNLAIEKMQESIKNKFGKKGEDIVNNNINAIKNVEENIVEEKADTSWEKLKIEEYKPQGVLDAISHLKGDELKVSDFITHDDGTFEVNTSKLEKRNIAEMLPCWNTEKCISCNQCVMACPHAVIRPKILSEDELKENPNIKTIDVPGKPEFKFALEFSYDDCTGCGVCSSVCPRETITMEKNECSSRENNKIKATNKHLYPENIVKGLAFNKPLFKYSGACAGCGETPYIKILTQIVGEGLIIANATGCSSIYGASMPSSPYNISWSNSLFEDNAEYGYGMSLTVSIMKEKIENIMNRYMDTVSDKNKELFNIWLSNKNDYKKTKLVMENIDYEEVKELEVIKEYIPSKSVWVLGGDGWSYDIGFSGIDHVMSTNQNVNILVLDTEVYSNTGGQSSKSTREGAVAKFASIGKTTSKKDLARMMMQYKNVTVSEISLGANMNQAIKAINEANNHNGPSLIIAYAPCINHGLKGGMGNSIKEEELAVKCGYFPLFRYNSNTKEFNLDFKEPDFSLYGQFLANETRYKMISAVNLEHAKELLEDNLNNAKERFEYYKSLDN
ncbi:MAG: pyruvate:ferredoxin (flavodoxin) oxidoreductase [Bacilli bacterium]|nr:pyruvate:ferredoxin (flavodoxin) oxidoreductase [Bacilli bacterium]